MYACMVSMNGAYDSYGRLRHGRKNLTKFQVILVNRGSYYKTFWILPTKETFLKSARTQQRGWEDEDHLTSSAARKEYSAQP